MAITVWSATKLDQQTALHWHQSDHDNDFGVEKWVQESVLADVQTVQNLGGNVKGQTATPAIFYGTGEDKDTERSTSLPSWYNLFNLEQTGIELPVVGSTDKAKATL